MKKILFNLLVTLSVAAACQKNVSVVLTDHSESLVGKMEAMQSTKTSIDENNNVLWSDGDQITAFLRTSLGAKYQVTTVSSGKTAAVFTKKSLTGDDNLFAGVELEHNIALYPFADDTYVEKSGENYNVTSKLPSIQTYAAESFSNGAFPMVAVSENNELTFKNVCGAIKLQLKGTQTIKSIVIEGKNNEKLSGAATVTAYPSGLAPAITMSADASTSVTLDCRDGVQLTENAATDFIIALPPVLFSKGFTVKVTDSDSRTYTVETDKANTVLRSSILVMPVVKLGEAGGDPEDEEGGELVIPVETITLSTTSISELYPTQTRTIEITSYRPIDATDVTFTWTSDTPTVATVDQTGKITAVSAGKAKITVVSGSGKATCTVTVIKWPDPAVATVEYVDEYGVNHGYGVVIGGQCWAPVNCGYHAEDFPYGKLYQWGRKYGQGLGAPYDKGTVTMTDGGVSLIGGQHSSNADKFFTGLSDWLATKDDKLWNTGTESTPKKSECDPCPEGWRVPVESELTELAKNHSDFVTLTDGQKGMYFSGVYEYSEDASKIFLPASGFRSYDVVSLNSVGGTGRYWSASPSSSLAYSLGFNRYGSVNSSYDSDRALGCSVRCLQE